MIINPNLYSEVLFEGYSSGNIELSANANNYKYLMFVTSQGTVSFVSVSDYLKVGYIDSDFQINNNPAIVNGTIYYKNDGTVLTYTASARWFKYLNLEPNFDKKTIPIIKVIGIK